MKINREQDGLEVTLSCVSDYFAITGFIETTHGTHAREIGVAIVGKSYDFCASHCYPSTQEPLGVVEMWMEKEMRAIASRFKHED